MPRNIALIGRARAGKDSVAARLVGAHGYTRVAFADPLREMALAVDPVLGMREPVVKAIRLQEIVDRDGWEYAKDNFPETRRILQNLGQSVRDLDRGFWLRIAIKRIADSDGPVVVTDCRYRNEAAALRLLGFTLVRVYRADQPAASGEHVSETELTSYPTSLTLLNNGSLAELALRADALV